MAVQIVPFSTPGDQVVSYTLPNAVSLAFSDDGGGGTLYLNGLGILNGDLSGAVDLKTLFQTTNGVIFRSYPLLSAFRRLSVNSNQGAMNQLVPRLHISIYPLPTGGSATLPKIGYLANIGGINFVPFLEIVGPAAAGDWRLDISLRHSITN
jgi:hypothetical protein